MIPDTVLGLLLFAASLGPGFLFMWELNRRAPRPDQTQLEQTAQMVLIGAFASLVSR